MRLIAVKDITSFPCMKPQYLQSLGKLGVGGWCDSPSWGTSLLLWMCSALLTFSGPPFSGPPFSCFIAGSPGPEGKPFLLHSGDLFELLHYWFSMMPALSGDNIITLPLFNIALHHLTVGKKTPAERNDHSLI